MARAKKRDMRPSETAKLLEEGKELPREYGLASTERFGPLPPSPAGTRRHNYTRKPKGADKTVYFAAQYEVPTAPISEPFEFYRSQPDGPNPTREQANFLEMVRLEAPEVLESLKPIFRDVIDRGDARVLRQSYVATERVLRSDIAPWLEEFHLNTGWIGSVVGATLQNWWSMTEIGYDLDEVNEWSYVKQHRAIGFDNRLEISFVDSWDPFVERRDVAERRLLAQFETEMHYQLNQVVADLQEQDLTQVQPRAGKDRPDISKARRQELKWLVWYQCRKMTWTKIAKEDPAKKVKKGAGTDPEGGDRQRYIANRVRERAAAIGLELRPVRS